MTFTDWVDESKTRYRTEPPVQATRRSIRAFGRGIIRRIGAHVGSPIWDRGDWDVLVVLDACRYDLMCEVAPEYDALPDENDIGWVWSNASCSIDWILRNFNAHPERARHVGYVTGNPFADHTADDARTANLTDDDLAHLAPLYKTEWQSIDGGPVETIPPEVLTDHSITAWREREDLGMDQLVIHYMQPHQPFRSRPDWAGVNKNLKNLVNNRTKAGCCAWQEARVGNIDTDELWEACADNLRWVLDDVVTRLLPNVEGTVVITADHGNAMGEWGEWAHPPAAIGPAVRRVPWMTVDCTDSGAVTPGVDLGETAVDEGEVDEQLRALGYR